MIEFIAGFLCCLILVFVWSLCVISSQCSRQEEHNTIKKSDKKWEEEQMWD